MKIALIGRSEATKVAVSDRLREHYGFIPDGIYRPFSEDLSRNMAQLAVELGNPDAPPIDQFGRVESTLRAAFGPDVFFKRLEQRLSKLPDYDIVASDAVQPDDAQRLAKLGFVLVVVTSGPALVASQGAGLAVSADQSEYIKWFAGVSFLAHLHDTGNQTELYRAINDLIAALAQRDGKASQSLRQGINAFRG